MPSYWLNSAGRRQVNPTDRPRAFADLPLLLTVPEAAQVLRIGRGAAYDAVRAGVIPSVRISRTIRVPRDLLVAMLQEPEAHDGHAAE
jgi:excisionase family DNA binding protein